MGRDQFVEIVFCLGCRRSLPPGMRMTKLFSIGRFIRQAYRFVQMGEEFLGSGRIIGASQFSGGELRIKRERFIELL